VTRQCRLLALRATSEDENFSGLTKRGKKRDDRTNHFRDKLEFGWKKGKTSGERTALLSQEGSSIGSTTPEPTPIVGSTPSGNPDLESDSGYFSEIAYETIRIEALGRSRIQECARSRTCLQLGS